MNELFIFIFLMNLRKMFVAVARSNFILVQWYISKYTQVRILVYIFYSDLVGWMQLMVIKGKKFVLCV